MMAFMFLEPIRALVTTINQLLNGYEPFTIIVFTILAVWTFSLITKLWQLGMIGIMAKVIRVLRSAPLIHSIVSQEQEKMKTTLKKALLKYDERPESPPRFFTLPECGLDKETLFRYLKTLQGFDQETLIHGIINSSLSSLFNLFAFN
jgi:hypothetical protein